jgi:tetratricopeptide (TPR) repeat protein
LNRLDEAVGCFQEALAIKPDYTNGHNNLGIAFKKQGQLDVATSCFQRALEISPNHAEAHLNLSLTRLLMGDFENGWSGYESRWKLKENTPRQFPQPLWSGNLLDGKTILLHAEQGIGDTIQFVRYAPQVKTRGGEVIVECQKPLIRLLKTCQGID